MVLFSLYKNIGKHKTASWKFKKKKKLIPIVITPPLLCPFFYFYLGASLSLSYSSLI